MDNRFDLLREGRTVLANLRTDYALVRYAGDKAIYIGRESRPRRLPESIWHNPFKEGSREENVNQYRDYILG